MLDIKNEIQSLKTEQYHSKFTSIKLEEIGEFAELDMLCQFVSACRGQANSFHTNEYELNEEDFSKKIVTAIADEHGNYSDMIPPRLMSKDGQIVLTLGDFVFPVEIKTDHTNYANFVVGSLIGNLHEEVKENSTSKEKYSLFFVLFDEKVKSQNDGNKTIIAESWLIRLAFKKEGTEFIPFTKSELLECLYNGTFHEKLKELGTATSSFKQTVPLRCIDVGCHQLQSYRKVELQGRSSWVLDFGYPVDFWANAQISEVLNASELSNQKLLKATGNLAKRCKPVRFEGAWLDVFSKETKGDKTFVNATLLKQGVTPKVFTPPLNGGIDPAYLAGYEQYRALLPASIEATLENDIPF